MSYARSLARRLDPDLIERIEAGGKPQKQTASKSRREPRASSEYRGHARNVQRGSVWRAPFNFSREARIIDGSFKGPIRLNAKRAKWVHR